MDKDDAEDAISTLCLQCLCRREQRDSSSVASVPREVEPLSAVASAAAATSLLDWATSNNQVTTRHHLLCTLTMVTSSSCAKKMLVSCQKFRFRKIEKEMRRFIMYWKADRDNLSLTHEQKRWSIHQLDMLNTQCYHNITCRNFKQIEQKIQA